MNMMDDESVRNGDEMNEDTDEEEEDEEEE